MPDDTVTNSRGLPAYQGYEYQIQVTAWVALQLMLRSEAFCDQLEVEPASAEDIRARLKVQAEDVTSTLRLSMSRELQIQIKLRSRPFSANDFKQLLSPTSSRGTKKGPAPRSRPIQYLRGKDAPGYVLITNAQVDPKLAPHLIQRVDEPSSATELPFEAPSGLKLSTEAKAELASRLGIIQQQTPQVVSHATRRFLRDVAFVPSGQLDHCIEALHACVRDRLLARAHSNMWARDELFRTIREHGGLPQHPHEKFIKPGGYDELLNRLERQSALVLVGSAGVGKTITASVLAHAHRARRDSFEVISSDLSPSRIRGCLERPGKYLFLLEDPWGAVSRQSPNAALWTNELPYLLDRASPDKRFLITSRPGPMKEAWPREVPSSVRDLIVELRPQDYSAEDRWELLRQTLHKHPLQEDFAIAHREQILSTLNVPYSLRIFGKQLQKKESLPPIELEALLHSSLMETLGHTVAAEVHASSAVQDQAALLVGFLLHIRSRFSDPDAEQVVRALRGANLQQLEFKKALEYLIRAGWVEERNGEYWAHPQVTAGLTSLFDFAPESATPPLLAWIRGLLAEGYFGRALLLLFELDNKKQPIPQDISTALDENLIWQIQNANDSDFLDAFQHLGYFSKGSAPEAVMARRLIGHEGFIYADDRWLPSDWSADERAALQASTATRELVARFIRHGWLKSKKSYYGVRFSALMQELGWSFHEEFADAARAALGEEGWLFLQQFGHHWDKRYNPFVSAVEEFLKGALSRPEPAFEEFLQLALDRHARALKILEEEERVLRGKFLPGSVGMLFGRMRLNCLNSFERALETIVDLRRQQEGYEWIRTHPRRQELVPAFGASMRAAIWPFTSFLSRDPRAQELRPHATTAELLALHDACAPDDRRPIWHLLLVTQAHELVPLMLEDLRTCPLEYLLYGISRLQRLLRDPELSQALFELSSRVNFVRRVGIAEARHHQQPSESYQGLPPEELRTVKLCLSALRARPTRAELDSLSPGEWEGIRQLAGNHRGLSGLGALLLLVFSGASLELLANSIHKLSSDELKSVALTRLAKEEVPSIRALLRAYLQDESSQCRRTALHLLVPIATPEERADILRLADDPCAVIQAECALQIAEQGWTGAVDTLFNLLTRSSDKEPFTSSDNPQASPIMRAAAQALAKTPRLTPNELRRCLDFVQRGFEAIPDPMVRCELISVLARSALPEVPSALEQCLESREALPGNNHSRDFPLRYAGAWGLFLHLRLNPDARNKVALDALTRAAKHPDARLAEPALVVLGLATPRSLPDIQEVFLADETAPHRALLVVAGTVLAGTSLPEDLLRLKLPADHPGLRLLEHARQASSLDSQDWEEFLRKEPVVDAWLASLREAKDARRVLRWLLFELFGRRVREALPFDEVAPGVVLTEAESFDLISKLEWRGSDSPPHMW